MKEELLFTETSHDKLFKSNEIITDATNVSKVIHLLKSKGYPKRFCEFISNLKLAELS